MIDIIRRYQRPILVLFLVLYPLFAILAGRRGNDGHLGLVGTAFFQTNAHVQQAVFQAVGGIADFWSHYIDLVNLNEENERLTRENARLQEERVRLISVMQENSRLRQMVGFQERETHFEMIPAHVIAKDISPHFRVVRMRLDVGNALVSPGMPVVAPSGLIGQVTTVSGNFCDVMLSVDTQSRIDILVQRNRARGILIGNGHEDNYTSHVSYLLQRDEAQVGDVVVTSGQGGRFPSDLIVGNIIEVSEDSPGLYQEVTVQPSVDFSRLEEVYIITNMERP